MKNLFYKFFLNIICACRIKNRQSNRILAIIDDIYFVQQTFHIISQKLSAVELFQQLPLKIIVLSLEMILITVLYLQCFLRYDTWHKPKGISKRSCIFGVQLIGHLCRGMAGGIYSAISPVSSFFRHRSRVKNESFGIKIESEY